MARVSRSGSPRAAARGDRKDGQIATWPDAGQVGPSRSAHGASARVLKRRSGLCTPSSSANLRCIAAPAVRAACRCAACASRVRRSARPGACARRTRRAVLPSAWRLAPCSRSAAASQPQTWPRLQPSQATPTPCTRTRCAAYALRSSTARTLTLGRRGCHAAQAAAQAIGLDACVVPGLLVASLFPAIIGSRMVRVAFSCARSALTHVPAPGSLGRCTSRRASRSEAPQRWARSCMRR